MEGPEFGILVLFPRNRIDYSFLFKAANFLSQFSTKKVFERPLRLYQIRKKEKETFSRDKLIEKPVSAFKMFLIYRFIQ